MTWLVCWSLFSSPSMATAKATAETTPAKTAGPETVIELSVEDLIGKRGRTRKVAGLPAGYGREVAERLRQRQVEIRACAAQGAESAELQLQIQIAKDGRASVAVEAKENTPATECLQKLLSAIIYPTHTLHSPVAVQLPMVLRRLKL